MSTPLRSLLFLSLAVASLGATRVRGETVFVDSFDDGDPSLADSQPRFWTVIQQDGNMDSSATERDGSLHLRAATWSNAYVSLASQSLEDFGFFTRPVTITLEDFALEAKGIAANEARFKLSLASSSGRAERADDVVSLRVRPGLLLLGYRADGFDLNSSPENLSGQRANSVVVQELSAMPSKLSLTLGPAQTPGFIRYEIHAEGNGVAFTRSGTFALTLAQWGSVDAAALVLDARRDGTAAKAGTHAEFSLGKITVSR